MTQKTILITGAQGQLGQTIAQSSLAQQHTLLLTDRDQLDITQREQVKSYFEEQAIDLIINCAAYTQVDLAEKETALAEAVNTTAVQHLVEMSNQYKAPLVHISTDFIFDGQNPLAYTTDAEANPLSVYGETKYRAEQYILQHCHHYCIVRTAWVYSAYGHNFVKSMLALMRSKPALSIVCDQVGSPTSTLTLTTALTHIVDHSIEGIIHWTDNGIASWYDFAVGIQQQALALGLLEQAIPIHAIESKDYPTPAQRPAMSVLDKHSSYAALGYQPGHWRVALDEVLKQLQ